MSRARERAGGEEGSGAESYVRGSVGSAGTAAGRW